MTGTELALTFVRAGAKSTNPFRTKEKGAITMDDLLFGLIYVFGFIGGFLLLLALGDVIMNLLNRIPFVRKKLDNFYDSLPMSDEDW